MVTNILIKTYVDPTISQFNQLLHVDLQLGFNNWTNFRNQNIILNDKQKKMATVQLFSVFVSKLYLNSGSKINLYSQSQDRHKIIIYD